jgi:cobalt-zinc-cadmium efflux system protein
VSCGHDHSHEHSHGHGHAHAHAPRTGRAFALSVALNGSFVVVELAAGVLAGSVALVADAAHNFGDVIGLLLAWGASRLAKRKPSDKRTYGLRRSTILASLANALLLVLAVGGVGWEAIGRLRTAAHPEPGIMLAVAAVGVAINGGSALLFLRERKRDTNVRGAFLHLMGDAAISVGVVVVAALVMITGWTWLDPVVSLAISFLILASSWSLLRDALDLALDAVPGHIDANEVRTFLASCPNVLAVHDLHIWALSTTETALTGHLVMSKTEPAPSFLHEIAHKLEERFSIHHTTLQIEPPGDCVGC